MDQPGCRPIRIRLLDSFPGHIFVCLPPFSGFQHEAWHAARLWTRWTEKSTRFREFTGALVLIDSRQLLPQSCALVDFGTVGIIFRILDLFLDYFPVLTTADQVRANILTVN